MPESPHGRSRNLILASLPAGERAALEPALEPVELRLREVLIDVDRPITHVWFPEGALVSVLGVMADGTAVETATIGREGMAGLPLFLGTDRTSAHAFTQVPGPALRMEAGRFLELVRRSPGLTLALNRYTQALFTLVAQSSACNRLHTMVERCARWLLHTHDRVGEHEFPLTHQFLSQMLGVRRATVTETMQVLQERGAVTYEKGRVSILDRARLEREACECYAIIVREFARLLGAAPESGAMPPNPLEHVRTEARGESTVGDGAPRDAVDGDGGEDGRAAERERR